jgi:hypothetical protein
VRRERGTTGRGASLLSMIFFFALDLSLYSVHQRVSWSLVEALRAKKVADH